LNTQINAFIETSNTKGAIATCTKFDSDLKIVIENVEKIKKILEWLEGKMIIIQIKLDMTDLMKHSALRKGGGYYTPE